MSNVLVLVEHAAGAVKKASFAGISFGQEYAKVSGGKLHLAVIGKGAANAAEQIKGYGAASVLVAGHGSLDSYLAESWAAAESSTRSGVTTTRISRPAWITLLFSTPGKPLAISSSLVSRLT